MKEIWVMYASFMGIEVVIDPLAFLDTLVEKVKFLAYEVTKKNEALAFTLASLSKEEDALD